MAASPMAASPMTAWKFLYSGERTVELMRRLLAVHPTSVRLSTLVPGLFCLLGYEMLESGHWKPL